MNLQKKLHKLRAVSLIFGGLLTLVNYSFAQFELTQQPGDVYKEYYITTVGENYRVTDPDATHADAEKYKDNPEIVFYLDDLEDVLRIEVVLDVWGGHVGTTEKEIRFNEQDWIEIPEITTTPTEGQCYMQQVNYILDVPLGHLQEGKNTVQGNSGGQSCHNFGWGQWGFYGAVVRIYYDAASKPYTTGYIDSHSSGDSFMDHPTISLTVDGEVEEIEILAKYEGYDADGDGIYFDWIRNYHRQNKNQDMGINGHVGTITTDPYSIVWNTEWVPDQVAEGISLMARIKSADGYFYVTDVVDELTLVRADHSVTMHKPQDVPRRFWVRDGDIQSTSVEIDADVFTRATDALFLVATWGGVDGTSAVNDVDLPVYGNDYFYSFDTLGVALATLVEGENTITFQSNSLGHGMEILWPGPAFMIKGAAPEEAPVIAEQPGNTSAFAGEPATFSVVAQGTGTISYQWQKNGVDIDGATASSYSIPHVAADEEGDIYNVVVSNAFGSTISNDAILTLSYVVLDLPFSESLEDISGQGNDGVASGAEVYTSDLFGTDAAAFYMGSTDPVVVPHAESLSVENVTLSAWIWVDSYQEDQRIISKEFDGGPFSSYSMLLGDTDNDRLQFRIAIDNKRHILSSESQIPLNQWVHVASTFDGAFMKVYIDGALDASLEVAGAIRANANPVYIGGSQFYDRLFDGKIDEAKVYKGALGEDKLALLAYNHLTLNTLPAVASDLNAETDDATLAQVEITWVDNADNAYGYLLERQKNDEGFLLHGTTSADVTTYLDDDLEDGNTYQYRVVAFSTMGEADPSDVLTLSVNDPADMQAPAIEGVSIAVGLDTAAIAWTTSEPAFGAISYGLDTSYGTTEQGGLTKHHRLVLRNLKPSTTYHYQVESVDGSTNASSLDGFSFETKAFETIYSDDFNADELDTEIWTFEDPLGGGEVTFTGSEIGISIPEGTEHSLWTNGNNTARITQDVGDIDFEIEVKLVSELEEGQFFGFLVEQTESQFLRLDMAVNKGKHRFFAAFIDDNRNTIFINESINYDPAAFDYIWLRAKRNEDQWTFSYSYDGETWEIAGAFTQVIEATSAGIFVGNRGEDPAHNALFDYFINVDAPVAGAVFSAISGDFDDPEIWFDNEVPAPGSDIVIRNGTTVTLTKDETVGTLTLQEGSTLALGGFKLTVNTTIDTVGVGSGLNAAGGTVEYAALEGEVCVEGLQYHHLVLSGGGVKTMCGSMLVTGDLDLTENVTFSGDSDFQITLQGDWTSASTVSFLPEQSTVLFGGATSQFITPGAGSQSFYNLIFDNAAGFVAEGDITIENQLTLQNGVVDLDPEDGDRSDDPTLTINPALAISLGTDGASYIEGIMQTSAAFSGDYLFPLGDGDYYRPITLSPVSASAFDRVVLVKGTPPGDMLSDLSGLTIGDDATVTGVLSTLYWDVNRSEGTGNVGVNVQLQKGTDDIVGDDLGQLILTRYTGTEWEAFLEPNNGTLLDGSAAHVAGVTTGFSIVGAAVLSSSITLPVELLQFSVQKTGASVELLWSTSSEINNDFFSIEKSIDGEVFSPIGVVDGKGNTSTTTNYSFLDREPSIGYNFYRLSQTDFDGTTEYLDVQFVQYDGGAVATGSVVYPNPVLSNEVFIQADLRFGMLLVNATLYNALGQKVFTAVLEENQEHLQVPTALENGVYFLHLSNLNHQETMRIVLSR